jgi:hypothetical protein
MFSVARTLEARYPFSMHFVSFARDLSSGPAYGAKPMRDINSWKRRSSRSGS